MIGPVPKNDTTTDHGFFTRTQPAARFEIRGQDSEFLTLPVLADLLGLNVRVLRTEAGRSSFPTYTCGGVRRRARLVDVRVWVQSTLSEPVTEEAVAHADGVVTARLQRETQKRRVPIYEQPASRDPRGQEKARSSSATPTPSSVTGSSLTET